MEDVSYYIIRGYVDGLIVKTMDNIELKVLVIIVI